MPSSIGTDLPIFREQASEHYTLEDILNTYQRPDDFQKVGYAGFFKYNHTF